MADLRKSTDGPSPKSAEGYDPSLLPDFDYEFIQESEVEEFAKALNAPDPEYITALNDWRPVHQRVKRKGRAKSTKKRKPPRRTKDETREGFVYTLLKWPLLGLVFTWIIVLGLLYLLTRLYIYLYEQLVTWRGRREKLRRRLANTASYADWVRAAKALDAYLGNEEWKETDEYAYYDYKTIGRVLEQMKNLRILATEEENGEPNGVGGQRAIEKLNSLVEASVKNNFVGVENPRLYSQTYYGTKDLVQEFVDECKGNKFMLLNP
jgi:Domain of unknown function (DUF3336)